MGKKKRHKRAQQNKSNPIFAVGILSEIIREINDDSNLVYYISREEIERFDMSRFLSDFGPEAPKTLVASMIGKVIFDVCGYEDLEEKLFEIEDVRNYFRELHRRWPCWLYYSQLPGKDLNDPLRLDNSVTLISLLTAKNAVFRRTPGTSKLTTLTDAQELKEFLEICCDTFCQICESAQLSEQKMKPQMDAITNYMEILASATSRFEKQPR